MRSARLTTSGCVSASGNTLRLPNVVRRREQVEVRGVVLQVGAVDEKLCAASSCARTPRCRAPASSALSDVTAWLGEQMPQMRDVISGASSKRRPTTIDSKSRVGSTTSMRISPTAPSATSTLMVPCPSMRATCSMVSVLIGWPPRGCCRVPGRSTAERRRCLVLPRYLRADARLASSAIPRHPVHGRPSETHFAPHPERVTSPRQTNAASRRSTRSRRPCTTRTSARAAARSDRPMSAR